MHHHISELQYGNCLPESILSQSKIFIPDPILNDHPTNNTNEHNKQLKTATNHDHEYTYVSISL